MRKFIILISVLILGVLAYAIIPALTKQDKKITDKEETAILPKVLYLTTGLSEGNGEISEGVVLAIQSFSKKGAFVWLDTREVLMQPEKLSEYSIMILPTSMGYHDGDRKYSLTFLSDFEMENIVNWVKNGGTLITEENIGRNAPDGSDRADKNGELNPQTWKLSEMFGIKMTERDLNGFSIEEKDTRIWNSIIKQANTEDEWVLIPSEVISDKVKVLAEWVNGSERFPAIICNDFGKGKAVLFTSTYILHPSNDGGVSGVEQIENFYNNVLSNFTGESKYRPEINPWPDGRSSAFCISFNSEGLTDNYQAVLSFLKSENLSATFFIDSSLTKDQLNLLESNKNIVIQSELYSKRDYSEAGYSEIAGEILMNEQKFGKIFTGLRFPFYSSNFWGLLYADDKGYIYDSSIGVDHLTSYTGSVIPYNIPVSKDTYYKSLKLIEICPLKNDDVFYFQRSENKEEYTDELQRSDAQLFEKYLLDFYDYAVVKNNGVMVYVGNPQYTAFSEITMQPLKKICDTLKTKNCWMTTLEDVAAFRKKIKDLTVGYSESGNKVILKIHLPGTAEISGLSFKLKSKPSGITANGKYDLKETNGTYYLIADVKNGDELVLEN